MSKHVHLKRVSSSIQSLPSKSQTQHSYMLNRQRMVLAEEYRLVERRESQINGAWRGAHILLFFLAFIFGSFCTFCFHMLMYMFDDKCVLFPKLLAIKSRRHRKMEDFIKDRNNNTLRVEFVNAQWMDHSVCYLPVYVPLVSGIFGLVWITMFLMCSAGTRTHAGLHSPWRVLFPVFLFSVAMSILCLHTSSVTQAGLQAFCDTLSEITNGSPCSYAVNVVSLAYHRRIRGVYQATQLTIISAWFHTICWLCSVALVLIRVGLAVDFQLVRVRAELIGDIDLMLQRNEKHVRTISPDSDTPKTNVANQDLAPDNVQDKQGAADTSPKEKEQSELKDVINLPKNKLFLPQALPAKSTESIKTIQVKNISSAPDTNMDNAESPNVASLFMNSPSSSASEDRKITPKTPESLANESNTIKSPESTTEDNALEQKKETDTPTSQKSEYEKKASKFESPGSKKVNINKYILAHRPSLDVTQIKEIVDHEAPKMSRDSSKSRSSRLANKVSPGKEKSIDAESTEMEVKDDQAVFQPGSEKLTLPPLVIKDSSLLERPITKPDDHDEARRSLKLGEAEHSQEPTTESENETNLSKEHIITLDDHDEKRSNEPKTTSGKLGDAVRQSTERIAESESSDDDSLSESITVTRKYRRGTILQKRRPSLDLKEIEDYEAGVSKDSSESRSSRIDIKASSAREMLIEPQSAQSEVKNKLATGSEELSFGRLKIVDSSQSQESILRLRSRQSDYYGDARQSTESTTAAGAVNEAKLYGEPENDTKSKRHEESMSDPVKSDDKKQLKQLIAPDKNVKARRWSVARSHSSRNIKEDKAIEGPEKVDSIRRWSVTRYPSSQISKHDETKQTEKSISGSEKDVESSFSKGPTATPLLPHRGKDDKAIRHGIPEPEKGGGATQSKEQVAEPQLSQSAESTISEDPIAEDEKNDKVNELNKTTARPRDQDKK